ncbi:MAG: hypothetical protein K6C14_00540 [Eubacterium sp.]|nr:hypothetical protein [Eubacterium sp.]
MTDSDIKELRKRLAEGSEPKPDEAETLTAILSYSKGAEEAKRLAEKLLKDYGTLNNLLTTPPSRLVKNRCIDEQTAVLISLFYTGATSLSRHKNDGVKILNTPEKAKEYAYNLLRYMPNEQFLVISLNDKKRIISYSILFEGTVNSTYIEPQKIAETLIDDGASRAIIAHNHPNGAPHPSQKDIGLTVRIRELLNMTGIILDDHIIVGKSSAVSMKYDTDSSVFNS